MPPVGPTGDDTPTDTAVVTVESELSGAIAADWNSFQGRKGPRRERDPGSAVPECRRRSLCFDKIIRGLLLSCATRQRTLGWQIQSPSCQPVSREQRAGVQGSLDGRGQEVLVICVKRSSSGNTTGCEPVRGSQLQVPGLSGYLPTHPG